MPQVCAADAEYLFVVPILPQEFFAIWEEIVCGQRVLEENDAFFLVFEEPLHGLENHFGLAEVFILP